MASAKCRNRVSCDLALRDEWIEIPDDGRCPECGQTLQTETNTGSAIDDARKKRVRMLVIGGGLSALLLAGGLVWLLTVTPTEPVDIAQIQEPKLEQTTDTSQPADNTPQPASAPPEQAAGPSLETQQHVKQGMMFVSLAKQSPKTHSENIKNALVEFEAAIKQEEAAGRCFANAYMNHGIAYWQDNKMNLAEKDLLKASECDVKDPIIFYNLAAYYSTVKKLDLALAPLDKALELGFGDCEVLRKDPDLENLRKEKDFRGILENHKLFCLK